MKWFTTIALFIAAATLLTSQCRDELLLDNTSPIIGLGLDSTGHWWVKSQPFEKFESITIDGTEFGPYHEISDPIFHRDGSAWACWARTDLRWTLLTSEGKLHRVAVIDTILYPSIDTDLWWVESNGLDRLVTNGVRSWEVAYPITQIAVHPQSIVVAWVEERPGVQVLIRNGVEVARGDRIILGGVWMDGRCLYGTGISNVWSVSLGETVLATGAISIRSLQMNFEGTVCAWVENNRAADSRIRMFSDEMYEPWRSVALTSVEQDLVLSPQDALLAVSAERLRRDLVFFNSIEYPAGRDHGAPMFTNDGSVMAYSSRDGSNYLVMNGKRELVNGGIALNADLAVAPSGEMAAWTSSTTLVTIDLFLDVMVMGKMCDFMTEAVYDDRARAFKALGVVTGRVFLLSCKAR